MAKAAKQGKPLSKGQVLANLAEATDLTKKQVAAVMEALADQVKQAMSSRGPGVFTIPGLVKIKKRKVAAKKAGKRMDPFTKEIRDFPAKPASVKPRVLALKALKEMVK